MLALLLAVAALLPFCNAFVFARSAKIGAHGLILRGSPLAGMLQPQDLGDEDKVPRVSVDVSDLGINASDLNKPIEIKTESMGKSARGYYSWIEELEWIEVVFAHPGTSGQPADAIRVDFTETTVSVCVFNYAVWMSIPSGRLIPEKCSFRVEDPPAGQARVPIVKMLMAKSWESQGHWGEAFEEVAPNSMLQ
ncbi:hypothetical protein B484DRAFT_459051 [Ochromonadaceae sp. CCMP2298]|nr:hypothetical protein B484DRAFT_459051 [Ochromonadaceae sp. CCMP2298]|mmetsp:Transcript_967/g.2138  ORF Transcript_967/g.2138 Transcript_967/m.2138 type:complete len:193 (-) Transcript_967:173-751(-)